MRYAVVFDCFGVLVGTSYFTFRKLCPPDKLDELADAHTAADYGYLTRQEYASRIGEILQMDPGRVYDSIDQQHVRNEGLIDYVRFLRQNHKIAMLSNVGPGVMPTIFTGDELNELFDTVVLSFEVGMVKPDPNIYRLTAERLGVKVGECVLVDDRPEFCAGADAAGMQSVHYRSNEQVMADLQGVLAK